MSHRSLPRSLGTAATLSALLSACTINNIENNNDETGGTGAVTPGNVAGRSAVGAQGGQGGLGANPLGTGGAVVTNGGSPIGVVAGAPAVAGGAQGVAGGAIGVGGSALGAAGSPIGAAGRATNSAGASAVSAAGIPGVVNGGAGGAAGTPSGTAGTGAIVGVTQDCATPPASGPAGAIVSTTTGGLWTDAATWVGGKVPSATDHVVLAGEVQVNSGANDATITCGSVTITKEGVLRAEAYATRTIVVNGDVVNYGAVRNGPPYASYDSATLIVNVGGRFFQLGSYGVSSTHFIGKQDQGIAVADASTLAGVFVDDNPTSSLRACSAITAAGLTLTLGTSDAQRGMLDMGDQTLTLSAGELKIVNGNLHVGKMVGVLGATLNCDRITTVGTLTLDGDIRTDASAIEGSVKVLPKGVLYNIANAAPTLKINGNLETAGIVRRGPGYAAYGEGDLAIELSGNLTQNGAYSPTSTKFTGAATQTITQAAGQVLAGPFTDSTPGSAIAAGSALTFGATTFDLGGGTLDMSDKALTLSAGDFKVTSGVVRASKIVGVSGATMNIPKITAVGTLVFDGDVRTDASVIEGSIKVLATGVLYNVANAAPTLTIKGGIENAGTIRRGPGYAAYGEGDLTIDLSGDLVQNGPYTPTLTNLSGSTTQTISLGSGQILSGSFTDLVPSSPIKAGSNLAIGAATFALGTTGTFDMGAFAITHAKGELKIETGTLKADDITGATEGGASSFTIAAITPNSGTLTIHGHYPTSSVTITGNLVVSSGAHLYNAVYVEARVNVTGTITQNGTIGSGPGYASYDTGVVYLNGLKLEGWQ